VELLNRLGGNVPSHEEVVRCVREYARKIAAGTGDAPAQCADCTATRSEEQVAHV